MDAGDFDPSLARQADHIVIDHDTRRFLTIALLINSALYLTASFVAGIILGNKWAWALALISCGTSYLAPFIQLALPGARVFAFGVVAWSVVFGIGAGIALLFF